MHPRKRTDQTDQTAQTDQTDKRVAVPTESDDARFSTLFGGGLAGPVLYQIITRGIASDRDDGNTGVALYRQGHYTLTKKCLPQFMVLPNVINNRLEQPELMMLTSALNNRGYIIVSLGTNNTSDRNHNGNRNSTSNGPVIGDILTSINGQTVGQYPNDEAFGDCTWFLDDGDMIDIVVQRYCTVTGTFRQIQLQHMVEYLPTALDITTNDPQFLLLLTLVLVTTVATMIVIDIVLDSRRDVDDYCTEITILKPANYGPGFILEDPHYNPRIHKRQDFNQKGYYLRRLCPDEIAIQQKPNMLYEVMQEMQLSCRYQGKMEYITCPTGCVFNGDTLKQMLNIENDGVAWVFHDWLYTSHAFDVRIDGTQTIIPRDHRWVTDELMYTIIRTDGYVGYARMLQQLDAYANSILYNAWDHVDTHSNIADAQYKSMDDEKWVHRDRKIRTGTECTRSSS
jgi:hypothetical protein